MGETPAEYRLRRALARNWPGHGPAQWLVYCPDNTKVSHCYDLRETAEAVAKHAGMKCLALVPTLTDAEREAVELAIDSMNGVEDISASWSQRETAAIATLRGLLERTK